MEKNKIKKIILISLFSVLLTGSLFFIKDIVFAQTISSTELGLQPIQGALGLPSTDIRVVVARIIRVALSLLGIVALVLMLYAGFLWMTAGGEASRIEDAKKIMINAAIGLAIILSAYAITSFVISKLVDATTGGPGGGSGGPGGDGNPYLPPGIFYVDNLPQGGQMCIRNVHPAVTFNRPVDLATLNGNLLVRETSGNAYPGQWQSLGQNTVAFVPSGDCGGGPADCFAASTTYNLHFQNPAAIRTTDGQMTLNCTFRAGCGDVQFITGNGVDRTAPQVRIEPISSDLLRAGTTVPVVVSYTDDNGVQKIDLSADNYFVGSQTISGCQSTGSVTVNWPTVGIPTGQHTLSATGFDWSALNYTTSTNVNLLPQHCFDNALQADLGEVRVGPPACGGECGACSGTPCTNNTQCASGYCDTLSGTCVDRMRINGVSPLTGGPGTFVSISGSYFGNTPGRVFINNVPAPLAPCGGSAWLPWQIITEVPAGATTGPIRVETATTSGSSFVDSTNDAFGPMISNFTVDNVVHPGLCGVTPANGLPGSETLLSGRRLGNSPGQVSFGVNNVVVSLANWADTLVRVRVPLGEVGPVAVKVTQNNVESNSVRYFVEQGVSDSVAVISSVSPDHGARGEYVTITGNNFGNQIGRVWFKENVNGQPGDAIDGDFSFPQGCQNTWTNNQIIVKFPLGSGTPGRSYFVQVRPADASQGPSPIGPVFNLENGQPSPGICNINPVSGPVPFPGTAPRMQIVGEYFGATPAVYFWTEGASPTAITGRLLSSLATVSNLVVGQSISTEPPAGTRTGPVTVFRSSDNKISNPANFSVLDCVRNNNTCTAPNTHCCVSGAEAGLCRPTNQLCAGETITAGYIWRFSTRDIPPVPHVVERCNNNTDLGLNIPSPSPSILWDNSAADPHHNVCRSATVVTEFNLPNINNIARTNLLVNECQANSINETTRTCTVAQVVPISGAGDFVPRLSTENTSYLELNPDATYNTGKWKDNTWYQVVLKSAISSGAGTSTAFLAQDKPCGPGSSYCFVFRSDAQDCRMRSVVITPYTYWTSVLEGPMKRRQSVTDDGVDVVYSGHGISTQHCVMMNTAAFSWAWGSRNSSYASIFSSNNSEAKVSAIANTVGVGLTNPSNGVYITATATLASANYNGTSPLTIDLNNPEVVDFWPKCLQSCTNAEVGVRFNTTMSNRNLPGSAVSGPIKLLKCNDENCFNTTSVLDDSDVSLDAADQHRVLRLANSAAGSLELEPNTIYKVVISVSTTNINSPELLWSAARLGDPTTVSKPFNKEFSWRFKTKADRCRISRVDVTPNVFVASYIDDKSIFSSQPFSSPDTCSAQGQKLNPWSVSWTWSSAQPLVASVSTFSSRGNNPFCTLGCTRKGSSISVGSPSVPVCGNNIVENGEDCDSPNRGAGCSLDCRRLGNMSSSTCGNGIIEPNLGETCDRGSATSSIGCSNICLHTGSSGTTAPGAVNSSICGNGSVGSGEDCDVSSSQTGGSTLLNGLLGWWTMDAADANATQVFDKSGNNNIATISGPVIATGTVREAMVFDGVDDFLSFPTPRVNTTTISLWYKTNTLTLPTNHRMLFSGSAGSSGATYISLFTNNVANPFVSFRIGTAQRTLNSNVVSTIGKWTHVAVTWDGSFIRIYVDGTLRNTSANFAGAALMGLDSALGYIGKYQAANGSETFGSIDDVRIYNRAVSAAEVTSLYQYGQNIINQSSGCSERCLHLGTPLSSNWCFTNGATFGGFVQADFVAACRNSISRCGDGVNDPDEDAGCDLGGGNKASWCNEYCLANNVSNPECAAGAEGCNSVRQHSGSSLVYSTPSLCGDAVVGIGEDNFCETNLPNTHTGNNPWALVTGIGRGSATGVPPTQVAYIQANTTDGTASGPVGDSGQFVIPCGYTSDAQCQSRMGAGWGVATNGCCYLKPQLLSVTPGSTSTNRFNICPNTAIEAVFDQEMDANSVINNVVVARGTTSTSCGTGEDVTTLALLADDGNNLPWYKKVFATIVNLFKYIIGQPVSALRTDVLSTRWCAGEDSGRSDVELVSSTLGKVVFKLNRPLATDSDYFIALKDGIKSKQGISIGKNGATNKPISWKFITGERICEVDSVDVSPSQVYFDKVGATTTLYASAFNANSSRLQTIPGFYSWEYIWQPVNNSYATLQVTTSSFNTITAQNRNGETDLRATAVITSNVYSAQTGAVATGKSHVIVFLCENPWPPKDLYIGTNGPYVIFPYEDKVGNNDGYNLALNAFNNTPIPASPSGGYFNFRTYYCADSGAFGTSDDLPYLRPAVQVSASIVADTPTSSLKRFIFSNNKNSDGIGVAVFSNPQHLTVSEWFENDRALGGQGFSGNMQTTKIDGYDALTDGNNIYVDALNYSNSSNNLFSNIYLFSVNSNASAETRKVFEQLIANLKFNTNLTNYGYCGATMANPGASTTCQTDLDCSGAEVCSVQIDKLKRNYIRLRDLNEIQNLLGP